MKPVFIPPYIGKDVKSGAESRIFETLKKFKMENSYILHSLGLPRHCGKVYGEIDFVVLCERGAACLEIKGGIVERVGGMWIYKNRNGVSTKKTESPFAQAAGNMFALKEELSRRFKDDPKLRDIPVVCGVIFPDIKFNDVSQEIIPEIIFDKGSRNITGYINRLFDYWQKRRGGSETLLSPEEIETVKDYMRGDFRFIPALSERLDSVEETLFRLTNDQAKIMDALSGNDRIMIEGAAGTGKTVLALDYALKTACKGKKVLYLTFNKNLVSNLQKKIAPMTNPEIINIHALFGKYVSVNDDMVSTDSEKYFSEILPEEFRRYLDSRPETSLKEMKYDFFILDEGQDIVSPMYLKALEPLLKGGFANGKWAVFYDANQNIYNPEYQNGMEILFSSNAAMFKLSMNCRNTIQIGNYCEKTSGIKLNEFIKENGEEVREVAYRDDNDFKEKLSEIMGRLKRGGVKNSDITFLAPKRYQNSILSRAGVAVSENFDDETRDLPHYSTIQSFKGLDSKVVILCGLENIPEENYSKFLYIAATRARTLLYVMGRPESFRKCQPDVSSGI